MSAALAHSRDGALWSVRWKLTTMHFTLRRATACDADAIANVYSASFRLLTFLPIGQLSPKCGAVHFLRRLRRAVGTG
jgi:hypothetical protein